MNISSVVLRTRRGALDEVRRLLVALPGVEVHAATDDGRLVITLEDAGTDSAADTFVKLHDIQGVMSVAMIYQYSETPEIRSQES
jgi:periplasmic nitrate reductase NapD